MSNEVSSAASLDRGQFERIMYADHCRMKASCNATPLGFEEWSAVNTDGSYAMGSTQLEWKTWQICAETLLPAGKVMVPAEEWLAIQAEREAEKTQEFRMDRLRKIVQWLFPRYDTRAVEMNGVIKPLIHPEKSWWWNGASIDLNYVELGESGSASCVVESYVGGGEDERFNVIALAEWMEAPTDEEALTLVHSWIKEQILLREETQKQQERQRAEQDLNDARARLARLEGSKP